MRSMHFKLNNIVPYIRRWSSGRRKRSNFSNLLFFFCQIFALEFLVVVDSIIENLFIWYSEMTKAFFTQNDFAVLFFYSFFKFFFVFHVYLLIFKFFCCSLSSFAKKKKQLFAIIQKDHVKFTKKKNKLLDTKRWF